MNVGKTLFAQVMNSGGLVVNRHELFAHRLGDGLEPGSCPTGKDDAFAKYFSHRPSNQSFTIVSRITAVVMINCQALRWTVSLRDDRYSLLALSVKPSVTRQNADEAHTRTKLAKCQRRCCDER